MGLAAWHAATAGRGQGSQAGGQPSVGAGGRAGPLGVTQRQATGFVAEFAAVDGLGARASGRHIGAERRLARVLVAT